MLGPEPPEPRDLVEQMYCAEQIYIPPTFPYILKNWMKGAIRTQPSDLLKWSSAYFRALAEHRDPPVKTVMEYPVQDSPFHLTPGFIRILSVQFGDDPEIALQILWKRWDGVCLPVEGFQHILEVGLFQGEIIPTQLFLAVACALISKNLVSTMILFCESMTKEPEGGSSSIPYELFKEAYVFLARLDNGPDPKPLSPLPSNIDIVQELVKQKKPYIEREIYEEYIHCPGALEDVHEMSIQENFGPFISLSESTIEPSEETMAHRYSLDIVNNLIDIVFNVCEKRELDGITGMNEFQADYKMVYPIVDNILSVMFPEPSISELSWSSTYTVILEGEEEEEQEKVKRHYHIPGIGPRVSYIQIQRVLDFMKDWAGRQEEMVLKRNLRHVLCPPLDDQIEEFDISNDTSGIRPCPTEQCKTL